MAVISSTSEEVEYPKTDGEDQAEDEDDTDPDRNGLKTATKDGLRLAGDFIEFGLVIAHSQPQ